jgi:hypothetical protein
MYSVKKADMIQLKDRTTSNNHKSVTKEQQEQYDIQDKIGKSQNNSKVKKRQIGVRIPKGTR